MTTTNPELDCSWRVDEVITRHPATRAVFDRFGLDTCCGSAVSVAEAAMREGADPEALCAALHEAARPR